MNENGYVLPEIEVKASRINIPLVILIAVVIAGAIYLSK